MSIDYLGKFSELYPNIKSKHYLKLLQIFKLNHNKLDNWINNSKSLVINLKLLIINRYKVNLLMYKIIKLNKIEYHHL